jgi:hypothetical protein
MKTIRIILLLLLFSAMSLAQNRYKDPRAQLDSLRSVVLAPKMKLYDQQVEKFTHLIKNSTDKRCIKRYAKQLVNVSESMQETIASLYDCGLGSNRGGLYLGAGMGPWYPGYGGYMFNYPYDGYGYDNCLPQMFYEIDKIKRSANKMRLNARHANVNKRVADIDSRMEWLRSAPSSPGNQGVSVK